MTVTAPPRPPRPGDPVDREELEALVEALIEEARKRARRRRRIYGAAATLVALVGVTVFAVFERSAQSQSSSPALSARSGLAAGTTSSKLAFIRTMHSACCGRGPIELYVMNADGSGQRRLTRDAVHGVGLVARRAEDRLRPPQVPGAPPMQHLRHQRRRQRGTEADAQPGRRLRCCLVARRAQDRLQPRRRRGAASRSTS